MEFEKYVNPLEYPKKPSKPMLPVGKANETGAAFREYADRLDAYDQAMKDYYSKVAAYNDAQADCYGRFKIAALKEVGLWGHAGGNRAFEYVWNRGNGYYEAFHLLNDIAYIILGPQ